MDEQKWRPTGPVISLTLIRPWVYCMTDISLARHGIEPKRLENRSYRPPADLVASGLLALHNGLKVDRGVAFHLLEEIGMMVPDQPTGVVAVCRCTGYLDRRQPIPSGQARWFNGPYAWVLSDFAVLDRPLPMVGHRGFRVVELPLAKLARGAWLRAESEGSLVA
jgi:hypothetical protein